MVRALFAALSLCLAGTAAVPAPALPGRIVFVRAGDLYAARAGGLTRLTTGGGNSWPRWAPRTDDEVAYLHAGDVFLLNTDAGTRRQLTHGAQAGGPSWSPDGQWLAFLTPIGLTEVRVHGQAERRVLHSPQWTTVRAGPALSPLRTAMAVAWSPDDRYIAFPGGDCRAIADDCLSVLARATDTEYTVAAWGGGGQVLSGFDTTPAWNPSGSRLYVTEQHENTDGTVGPTQVVSTGPTGGSRATFGVAGDSTPVPDPGGSATLLVTAVHNGQSWLTLVKPDGTRQYLYQGYQADWRTP